MVLELAFNCSAAWEPACLLLLSHLTFLSGCVKIVDGFCHLLHFLAFFFLTSYFKYPNDSASESLRDGAYFVLRCHFDLPLAFVGKNKALVSRWINGDLSAICTNSTGSYITWHIILVQRVKRSQGQSNGCYRALRLIMLECTLHEVPFSKNSAPLPTSCWALKRS